MTQLTQAILFLILMLIAGGFLYFFGTDKTNCQELGGQYVRGLYYFECIIK